jgi:transcriptional regulator with PAS, ATPase and Fis domain
MNIQEIKQRYGIIGNAMGLNMALEKALLVAPTDLSVLISGESGTGKEIFSQIIHTNSTRKHHQYIAVNCGAIPDGTIDSELFGHEKGAFTGAVDSRKGYFEVVDNGTIFLDEVGELPLSTQVRLLRVLETGEYYRVGSSKAFKTNVRVVAATNVNLLKAIEENKFREDLYYRLNTVPITIPPLRERKDDIVFLFKKFANDCADRYRMPLLRIDESANIILTSYRWPGNIRQLKNVAEQIAVIEENRLLTADVLRNYLPESFNVSLPALINKSSSSDNISFANEREILYKILFDMKKDVGDLKKLVNEIMQTGAASVSKPTDKTQMFHDLYDEMQHVEDNSIYQTKPQFENNQQHLKSREGFHIEDTQEVVEESLSLIDKEKEFIVKALEKHGGKRKYAAQELGISERTLYRKIKDFGLE